MRNWSAPAIIALLVLGLFGAARESAASNTISIFGTDGTKTAVSDAFSAAHIKGVQITGPSSGVAYTSDSIYRTDDNGASWQQLSLSTGLAELIAGVHFTDEANGLAVIAGRSTPSLSLLRTFDGGASWTRSPIAVREQDLAEASLTDIDITTKGDATRLTIRLVSSSNFDRHASYVSTDGVTFTFESSTSELRSEKADLAREAENIRLSRAAVLAADENVVESSIATGATWLLTQAGTCFGQKTGCMQETRVRLGDGTDITPDAVKTLAAAERENARAAALAAPAFSMPPGGTTRISLNRGFDQCNAPSASQMLAWWNASPYYDVNIYMSGRNRACSAQPNLSAAWVDQVTAMGWGLIPTVVGYQSPCTSSTTTAKLSYDPPTAESQGRGEADIAVAAAVNLGLTAGSILYYDMESYSETVNTPGCRVATTAFLKGWTDRIKELNYKSGVYGSPTNAVNDWIGIPEPSRMEAVWLARWDLVMNVWTYNSPSPVVPTNVWNNHQRIKQWQNPHNETWGGVTINIDGNIADGPVAGLTIARNKNADFDGDGKSDVSIFRPDTGAWYAMYSSNSTVTGLIFGSPTDTPAPGDFDGDGKTDYAVFRASEGSWHWLSKSGIYTSKTFGSAGDVPAPADYNGDGKTDYAVYRPSTGTWYIANSDSQNTITYVQFGQPGDKPAPGDYDGDGKTDVAVFRPNGATGAEWWVQKSSGGLFATQFGTASDLAVPADYTGDGKTDIAFWQPSSGFWFILRSEDLTYYAFPFGSPSDVPAPGDFDGDGKSDASVFRPSNGVWYMLRSQAGFTAVQFGQTGDRPVENAYLPQ